MKIRPFLIAVLASASLASPFVMAHPGGHDDDEKAMPKTCEQLADTKRFIQRRQLIVQSVAATHRSRLPPAMRTRGSYWELFVYGVETSEILSRRSGGASLR